MTLFTSHYCQAILQNTASRDDPVGHPWTNLHCDLSIIIDRYEIWTL